MEKKGTGTRAEVILRGPDQEDELYKEYRITRDRIKFLYDYIESLRNLLKDNNLEKAFSDECRNLFDEWLVASYFAANAKDKLGEEDSRLGRIIRSIILSHSVFTKDSREYKLHSEYLKKAMQHTDEKYLAAEREYEEAAEKENEARLKYERYSKSIFTAIEDNRALVDSEIMKTYDEIDRLEYKKLEIIEKMDYIVYGEQQENQLVEQRGVQKRIRRKKKRIRRKN